MPGMPRRRPLQLGARTLLLTTLLALMAGCAGAGAAQPAGAPQGAGSGPGAGSAGSGGSSAAGTTGTVPSATGSSSAPATAPSPLGGSGCAAPATITIVLGHEPAPVCMRVGDTVTITAPPSARQPWQPMKSSDAAVLACTSHQEDQGALTAVCHALKPGAVIASTITAPFAGDPHGPPQFMWSLTIHVLPYV